MGDCLIQRINKEFLGIDSNTTLTSINVENTTKTYTIQSESIIYLTWYLSNRSEGYVKLDDVYYSLYDGSTSANTFVVSLWARPGQKLYLKANSSSTVLGVIIPLK